MTTKPSTTRGKPAGPRLANKMMIGDRVVLLLSALIKEAGLDSNGIAQTQSHFLNSLGIVPACAAPNSRGFALYVAAGDDEAKVRHALAEKRKAAEAAAATRKSKAAIQAGAQPTDNAALERAVRAAVDSALIPVLAKLDEQQALTKKLCAEWGVSQIATAPVAPALRAVG